MTANVLNHTIEVRKYRRRNYKKCYLPFFQRLAAHEQAIALAMRDCRHYGA